MSDLLEQKKQNLSLEQQKKQEENQLLLDQTSMWKEEYQDFNSTELVSDVYDKRHYSFLERDENKMSWHFGAGKEIKKEAEPAAPDDWVVVEKERDLTKAEKNVAAQEAKLMDRQQDIVESKLREKAADGKLDKAEARKRARLEANYFNDKLSLIKLQAVADLEKAKTQEDKLIINVNKNKAIVDAWTDYVKTMEIGSSKRESALKSKEKAQLDLYWAEYDLKLERTAPEQKKKAVAKHWRKVNEARIKKIISKSDENCHEDHIIETEINGQKMRLINMGRAFLGGTKPTYYYKDMATGKQYLYKKAENCCGIQKPEGAIVTEIGSKIQHIVDPEHEIPAIGITNSKGKYIGSIQEIMDVQRQPEIDLDKWQLGTKEEGGQDLNVIQKPEIQKQLLIFHCVDWLLCNFDTKGEHLLQKKDGSFCSIDKEGGMNKILKAEAQHMSCTYTPHNHEPIYNLFFRMYRDKKIEIHKEAFEALDKKIKAVEEYSDKEYMKMFEPYIKQVNKKPEEMKKNILARKQNLREEYNKFLSELRKGTTLPNA